MNKIRFMTLNARQTISGERKASGDINKKHIHTPSAQGMLISLEDLLFMIRTISGMFQRGSIIAAISAIVFINSSF
ncbi:MAG: hypothetical protein A3I73_01690 [Omnitrophica bacterium RIFCSPLOWO2_02_FULL_45_16]|nr:MAG: hypothetical protein A3I73_01690 [Omnitrophica bacterium RIFCSPLOWO2_02_FULL_45_16]